ncbi:MAG: serine/threonine-protein kinase [Candidatus Melainabacteria bacterium]|nr:serine/threonine-protein kinase [Candidatus Melainabacteria bacterium]
MDQQQSTSSCPVCGKQVTAGGGSMTSWIFGRPTCKCRTGKPSDSTPNPRTSLANRLHNKEKKQISFGDGYEVLELIGEGGMASVYKVRSHADDSLFAIKMLKAELARDPLAILRFKQEVKAAAKLGHPNLVASYELGEMDDGTPFFVMDYVDGSNLSALLIEQGKLTVERALEIFIAMCEAMEHAHSKGVVHRDLKPSNVLVNAQGLVKVVDFGIAKVLVSGTTTGNTASLTQTGELFGSPLYMSPEQCMGENSDERSDIYSLGCVIYELLSGRPPFEGANPIKIIFGHLNETPARFAKGSVGDGAKRLASLEAIVFCCLEKLPANRYQSVHDLLKDLENVKEGKPPSIARNSPVMRRNVLKKVAVVVGVLGLAGGAVFGISTLSHQEKPEAKAVVVPKQDNLAVKRLIDSFTTEIQAHPDEDYWYIMRGTTYRENGELVNALMDFTMAINKNPKNAKAYRERGWTHALMEQWQKAADDNTAAIELNPKYADAYIGRSRDYGALGKIKESYADASKAIELNPSNPMAYLNRAGAAFDMKNYKQSLADCDQCVKLNPADPHPRILRSRVAEKLGDLKKALDDLSFIVSKRPEEVPRIVERAYLYNKLGKYDLSLQDSEKALALDPKHVGGHIARATSLIGLNRKTEGFDAFERGLAVDPNNSEIWKLKGDIYAKMGELSKATENYDTALKLSPAYQDAIDARAKLPQLTSDQPAK